jgi:hypothetical protein
MGLAVGAVTIGGRSIWCSATGTRYSATLKSRIAPSATWQRWIVLPLPASSMVRP